MSSRINSGSQYATLWHKVKPMDAMPMNEAEQSKARQKQNENNASFLTTSFKSQEFNRDILSDFYCRFCCIF